jgi:ribonucleoside-diphosphate reductase alpha chain
LDIGHPDIFQFLDMRKPTGGDPNQKCLNLHHGVNIPDEFMQIIERCMHDPEARDDWALIDPHSEEVVDVVSAKELWIKILELRMQTGEPYLHFIDTSNRSLPDWLRRRGLRVRQSNLCSEITLPTDSDHTAVCCLSSFNLEYWDEWKDDEKFIDDCVEFLDNVLGYFNSSAGDSLLRATRSASNSRDVGLGALGFHALLQRKGIPFESALAVALNKRIFGHIYERGTEANRRLAVERGEAPYAVGEGVRLSHLFAIAPNASSSIIMGNTSPSIEPFRANAYRQDTLSGSMLAKNKQLECVLDGHGQNTEEVWSSIISHKGSVQHLGFLTEWEKDVYKTAMEIDQRWIIQHAADRQPFIDQAQSLNVFFAPDSHVTYVHQVHFDAWKFGLKTLYYLRSEKIAQVDDVGRKAARIVIQPQTEEVCIACE